MASLAKLKDEIQSSQKKQAKDITRELLDATQIGVIGLHELNQKRRSDMKYDLHPSYRSLCNPPAEEATVLFASLNDRVKELNEVHTITIWDKYHDYDSKYHNNYSVHDLSIAGTEHRTSENEPCNKQYHNDNVLIPGADYGTSDETYNKYHINANVSIAGTENGSSSDGLQLQTLQRARQDQTFFRQSQGSGQRPRPLQLPVQHVQEDIGPLTDKGQERQVETVRDIAWGEFVANAKAKGLQNTKEFRGGQLSDHIEFWKSLTSDKNIHSLVSGTHIEIDEQNLETHYNAPYDFAREKINKIDIELEKLMKKGVISSTNPNNGMYVSPIFTKEKSLRIILDLSDFNKCVTYRHFKMDNLQTAMNLMSYDCYMASIDWKDAYYSIPIAKHHRKYLCFDWRGQLYHYNWYPNVLCSALRNDTKISKVILAGLRTKWLS